MHADLSAGAALTQARAPRANGRWLRPEFQNPLLSKSEQSAQTRRALQPKDVKKTLETDELPARAAPAPREHGEAGMTMTLWRAA